ncbi:MAG TPA: tocopherol cyclase family protein [Capillimicrobium sp.]
MRAHERGLEIRLGPDAWLRAELRGLRGWPRARPYGGLGAAHALPGLGQYWHPHALGGEARGEAVLGGERVSLDGWRVYAEKNWSADGFPERWWWGHAASFPGADACVAFAGGAVTVGPVGLTATAVAVRVEKQLVRLGNPVLSPVRAEVSDSAWRLRGAGPRWSVELEGAGVPGDAHVLPVPLPADRRIVPGALQHLGGRLRLEVRRHGRRWFEGESTLAGLEHGGCAGAERELERRAATEALAA